jgi:hypothetical protein
MTTTTLLFLLLILGCPLMMMFMHRGGHGHGGQQGDAHSDSGASLDELRRRRAALDDEITIREER